MFYIKILINSLQLSECLSAVGIEPVIWQGENFRDPVYDGYHHFKFLQYSFGNVTFLPSKAWSKLD